MDTDDYNKTVVPATGNIVKPGRHETFVEVTGGEGNLDGGEVHLLLRSDGGELAQGWFPASDLLGAIMFAASYGRSVTFDPADEFGDDDD